MIVGPKNNDKLVEGQTVLITAVGDDDIDIRTATLMIQEADGKSFNEEGVDFVLPFSWYYTVPYGTRGETRKIKVVAEDTVQDDRQNHQ